MKLLDENEISKIMQLIVWDYDINPLDLYDIVTEKKNKIGIFDKQRILIRMIERLSWYDLVNLLGIEFLKINLASSILNKLRFSSTKDKYEIIRKVLQGETVSFTGWSPEYRKKIKHTLISHRRYGP